MYVIDRKKEEMTWIDADIPRGFFVDEMVDVEKIEKDLGKALRLALKEGNIILVKKIL